jgi:Tol biopolymer transport system component
MGEVYKARDTRLDRIVAIKILPSADPELRQRFEREAKAIAALTHPHICTLFDVGHEGGTDYLVMEYLEGETLADRLEKGALLLDHALKIAIDIADALDKAHRAGITHRDLKPGNVMLTKNGAQLLDFGLAKMRGPLAAGAGLSLLPTTPPFDAAQGRPNLTARGTILGTFQYMAPEQIEGQDADARTDIFAFGAVLYEMVTGTKAFAGKTQASLLGAILKDEPAPISTLHPVTPPALDHLVHKCLAKNPEDRWQSARDLTSELKWIAETASRAVVPAPAVARHTGRERLVWLSALTLVALVAAVFAVRAFRPPSPAAEMRVDITTPPTVDMVSLAMSPDGEKVVFVAASEARSRLWLRSLNAESSHALPGTDGASLPFWSADSRSVGFFANGKLNRIDIDGGSAAVLANAPYGRGGAWSRDGTLLFVPYPASPIFRLSAPGGEVAAVTKVESPQQGAHQFPQFLPDGRHFLYYVVGAPGTNGVYVGDLGGSETKRVLDADTAAVYAAPGHLLFVRRGTLFAQDFDPVRRVVAGNPFPVAEHVAASGSYAALSASGTGPIVYRTDSGGGQRQLAWLDQAGKQVGTVGDADSSGAPTGGPSLSPDGRVLALFKFVQGNMDIFLVETARGGLNRFTADSADDIFPIWSPDAADIVFSSTRNRSLDLYLKPASGIRSEELLLASPQIKAATDWSPDGRFLMFLTADPKSGFDIWALPMTGERKPFPVVQTKANERLAQFSPDGKWIAYESDESGRYEIYVQPWSGSGGTAGGKVPISTNGGAQARWRHDGRALFYVALDERLMTVPIRYASNGQALEPGTPVPLFTTRVGGALQTFPRFQYVVSSDGQRFLMQVDTEVASLAPITVILNWSGRSK